MSKEKVTARERSLRLLKTLTETDGAPGHEGEVKAAIRKELGGIAALSEDSMGSLIAEARGEYGRALRLILRPYGRSRFCSQGNYTGRVSSASPLWGIGGRRYCLGSVSS